jgi:FAD/FMN-containing dehydrogenase
VTTPPAPPDLDRFRRTIDGDIITPDDGGYDDARRLWNAIHDRRPSVIARPVSPADVATAIAFAREHDLEIQVRSGGHSKVGWRGRDGGLVVDMTRMRGVTVDPTTRTARVNGGSLLGELDVAAQAHGLVCPVGVVGHTGVAGLTLGGGVGRLQRHFGLTIDNLEAVELVTADGRHVRASATEEPELFWGLRGAGANFGIATAFEFRLHPFGPNLHRGLFAYPASRVHEVWDAFQEYTKNAPDEVAVILNVDRAEAGAGYPDELVGKPITYLAYNHSGDAADVERHTAGLRRVPGAVLTTIASQPYLEVQTANDLVFAWGSRSFILGTNADGIRPAALDELVEMVATAPGSSTFSITALGGAIARVPEDAMAYAGRAAPFDLSVDSSWSDPSIDAANLEWCRRALAVIEPDAVLGRYANSNADAGPEVTRKLYGDAKLARLAALKRAWDPDNVFHVNHNIAPA